MRTSLTPHNQNSDLSPSSSLSSAGPGRRVSICSPMSQHSNTLGDYVGPSMASHQTSEYGTQSSSSAPPRTPLGSHTSTTNTSMTDLAMTFSNNSSSNNHNNTNNWVLPNVPEIMPFNMGGWMSESGRLPSQAAVPWKPTPEKGPDIDSVLNMVANLIPPTSTSGNASKITPNAPANAPAASSQQGKRSRSRQENDDNHQHEKKRNGPSDGSRRLGRPQTIHYEIRELKDEDFENSCEWCPFFIYQPFKFDTKPWNSCEKQRAESSHIVTHMVADHGIIRGHNTKRTTQRYLTTCARHDYENKGKAECDLCQRVQTWSLEQQYDPAHAGKSVCLRCYEELPDKRALYNHLQEQSICLYREDLPMRRKSRILYTTFCSSDNVPRFNPPPESGPRDGARKRNMRTGKRTNTTTPRRKPVVSSAPKPPQNIIQPSLPQSAPRLAGQNAQQHAPQQHAQQSAKQPAQQHTQQSASTWSPPTISVSRPSSLPIKSELCDVQSNRYPATPQSAPASRNPFSHTHTQPTSSYIMPQQPVRSFYTEFTFGPSSFGTPYQNYMQLTQDTPAPVMLGNVSRQQPSGIQASVPIMSKNNMYPPAYDDSGYGSQQGDPFSGRSFEEEYVFPTQPYMMEDEQLLNNTLSDDWR